DIFWLKKKKIQILLPQILHNQSRGHYWKQSVYVMVVDNSGLAKRGRGKEFILVFTISTAVPYTYLRNIGITVYILTLTEQKLGNLKRAQTRENIAKATDWMTKSEQK